MIQDRRTIRDALCLAIATTLECSGRALPQFKDTDKPITDYDGLDSHCGLEVTVALEELLGVDDLGGNIFVKGTGKTAKAQSLGEVVDTILMRAEAPNGHSS